MLETFLYGGIILLILGFLGRGFDMEPEPGEMVNAIMETGTVTENQARRISIEIQKWANELRVDPWTLLSICWQESRFRQNTMGADGEIGIMQLMPVAVQEMNRIYGFNYSHNAVSDLATNIKVGSHYYRYCLNMANGHYSYLRDSNGLTTKQAGLVFYNDGWRVREKGITYMTSVIERRQYYLDRYGR